MAEKKKSTAVTISNKDMLSAILNPEYSGGEDTKGSKFPPVINILQSEKQYDAFIEYRAVNEAIDKAEAEVDEKKLKLYKKEKAEVLVEMDNGRLFVRKQEGVSIDDLVKIITGTIIKWEMGHEVYEKQEDGKRGKILGSYPYMVSQSDKEGWHQKNPDKVFKNMVKVILCLEPNPVDAAKMIEDGENPMALLVIKGAGWGAWMEAKKQMDAIAMASAAYQHSRASDLLVSAFQFEIGSQKETSSDGQFEYYVPTIKPTLNPVDIAFGFNALVLEAKDFSLFYGVKEVVEKQDAEVRSDTPVAQIAAKIPGDEITVNDLDEII